VSRTAQMGWPKYGGFVLGMKRSRKFALGCTLSTGIAKKFDGEKTRHTQTPYSQWEGEGRENHERFSPFRERDETGF